MAQLTTRTTSAPGATAKGSPLTNAEVDQNFNRLNKAGPQIRPSLLLDFANSESVDNRITFSRASAATYYDANGVLQTVRDNKPRIDFDPVTGECKGLLIEEQRTNLHQYSSSFDGISYFVEAGSYRNNAALAPDGSYSGAAIIEGSTFYTRSRLQITVSSGTTYTYSAYLKRGTRTQAQMQIYTSATNVDVVFDLSAGTIISGSGGTIMSVGNGWYKCSVTAAATSNTALVFSYPAVGGGYSYTHIPGAEGIYIWGAQLEAAAFQTSHIPTNPTFASRSSFATYFDSAGTLRIAGNNQPRYGFGYDAASGKWISQGLVLEAAATNLFTASEAVSGWFTQGATQSRSSTLTPSGNYNAFTVTEDTSASSRHGTYVASIPYSAGGVTVSVFIRPIGRTKGQFVLYGGTMTTVSSMFDVLTEGVNVGNGWYRISKSFTVSANVASGLLEVWPANNVPDIYYTGSGTAAWDIYGLQVEAGYVPTSYIPTFGSASTRAADVSSSAATTRGGDNAKLAGANFSSWWNNSAHSVFAEAMTSFASNDYMIAEGANDSNQIVEMSLTFAGSASAKTQYINRLVSTANDMRSAASAYTANGFVKVAGAGSTSATLGSTSGVSNTSAGNQSSIRNANQMMIGSRQGGSLYLNGCIKKLAFFNKALSQNELNALTQ